MLKGLSYRLHCTSIGTPHPAKAKLSIINKEKFTWYLIFNLYEYMITVCVLFIHAIPESICCLVSFYPMMIYLCMFFLITWNMDIIIFMNKQWMEYLHQNNRCMFNMESYAIYLCVQYGMYGYGKNAQLDMFL